MVYTGRGDDGETDLRDRSRVSKASPRIEAYGTVDEVNALVGRVRPTGEEDVDERLRAIQNHLHVVQAELANPDTGEGEPTIDPAQCGLLEDWMDDYDDELPPLDRFVLPGGCGAGSDLHHARTVCRRAERRTVALAAEESVGDAVLTYLNRLSDALFVFARVVNARAGAPEESPSY
jgi:cob(I)alamin adenosyltransferase